MTELPQMTQPAKMTELPQSQSMNCLIQAAQMNELPQIIQPAQMTELPQ